MSRIALVNMPFCSARAPSLQLGLLKALLARSDIAADVFYFNLDFAAAIGPELYELVAGTPDPMLGEWLFTRAAFPEFEKPPSFLSTIPGFCGRIEEATGTSEADLLALRDRSAPDFVCEAAKSLASYDVIGFTSTFQQNIASLALAMAVKRLKPAATIVFGGANVEGSVGATLLESFSCIDVIVNGECDAFAAELFDTLLRAAPVDHLPGVLTRAGPRIKEPQRATYAGSMDDLPVPDYDGFFPRRAELGLDEVRSGERSIYGPRAEYAKFLPFESSRGCWWGQKHHCTFCGLNAGGMKYRARSNEATVDLICGLHRAHGVDLLYAVDNIINAKDIDGFCDLLAAQDLDTEIFYETKSNLRPATIRKMAAAGIRYVQPGIESFSDHVLQLMRKGVSGLQNLNTLRWFRACNIRVAWNILYGFPGETACDYGDQLRLLKKIHHLPPPGHVSQIRIDRYSPNFFDPELRKAFGELRALDSYNYIYPDGIDRNEAAHFFYPGVKPATALGAEDLAELFREVDVWNAKWNASANGVGAVTDMGGDRPFLQYARCEDGSARISDGRSSPRRPVEILLNPDEARAYEFLFDRPRDIRSPDVPSSSSADFQSFVRKFDELELIHVAGSKALALATADSPVNP